MKARWEFAFLSAAIACSAASASEASDAICSKIAEFSSTAEAKEIHSVALRGGWGGESKDTLMTHECIPSNHYGEKLCEYLLPNSSWEFGMRNAERAADCLNLADRRLFLEALKSDREHVEITSHLQAGGGAQVTLRFERPRASSISVLTIAVRRNGA